MRLKKKSNKTANESLQFDTSAMNNVYSLGVGYIMADGKVSFQAAKPRKDCETDSLSTLTPNGKGKKSKGSSAKKVLRKMLSTEKILSPSSLRDKLPSAQQLSDKILRPVNFERIKSCYLRVADLKMSETSHSAATNEHEEIVPNFHHASVHPPPGVERDPNEMWVAIDTGDGSHAPIAPFALEALAKFGARSAMDAPMWTPDRKTDKLINSGSWHSSVWQEGVCTALPPRGSPEELEVMVWTGNFKHGLYGSELPAVRAAGIVNMSARALTELLLDSSRVKEYNEMSLGRIDLMVMPGSLEENGPFGKSVTKVMQSETKPPLLRKVLQFVTIMHAKELDDGSGYLLVSRAVTKADHGVFDPNILRSEILMGVNVIRKVEGDEERCLMINVNHIRSPFVPMMVAKRIGLTAAANFFNDLRALC
jgi:hypothetical protein